MLPSPSFATIGAVLVFSFVFVPGGHAHAGDATLSLKPAQVDSLGLRAEPAVANSAGAATRYPATVVVPSSQQRVVAAPLPGLVESLRASVGDTVRAGQVLAVLRSPQAQELQHDVHVTHSQAVLATAARARDEQLFKEGLISLSRIETSRAHAELAQEQQKERHRALLQAGGAVNGAGGGITLTAPINGVVLERQVVLGQRVDQAAALYRIANLSPLWIELQMPAGKAASVRIGDILRVFGSQAKGRVIGVGYGVDSASQTVLVRGELHASLTDLRAGQAVEAQVESATTGLTQVPADAVVDDAGRALVFVEDGAGQYRATPVQVVSSGGGVSAVRGVATGSKVVVQGTAALKSLLAALRK